ncbi:HAD hydrolase family protein [Streptococcus thermophilus]
MPIHELNEPIKVVIPLVEHEDIREDLIFNLNKLECLDLSYHDIEKCLYINPKGVTKASTVLNHFGKDFVAFGNDQNDISLFKNAIYGVQIGDYPYLITLRMRLFLQLMQLLLKKLDYCLKNSKQMLRLIPIFTVQ